MCAIIVFWTAVGNWCNCKCIHIMSFFLTAPPTLHLYPNSNTQHHHTMMMIMIIMMSHEFEYVWILTLTLNHHSILHERLHCSACQSLIHHDHSPSPSLCHSQTDTSPLPFTCSQFILLIIIIYCYPIIMIWYRCLGVFHCWREDAHSVDWGCSCILIQLIHLWLCIYLIYLSLCCIVVKYLLRHSSSLSVICIRTDNDMIHMKVSRQDKFLQWNLIPTS